MECTICKHGKTSPGFTTITLERDGKIVFFKNVPAQICDNCGEYYLSEATTKMVHSRANLTIENGEELAVIKL